MEETLKNNETAQCRLFALMADEYVILKLFWEKENAEKELEVYKREHKDALFFVDEVDVH